MLYLDYSVPEDIIVTPSAYYDTNYEKSWFDDPEVVRVACTIDCVTHISGDVFHSDVLGTIPSTDLSGGVKTIILAMKEDLDGMCLPLSWLGENCYPVLGSVKITRDVVFNGDTVPLIYDWGCVFKSKLSGKLLSNTYEYRKELVLSGVIS